jgi:hypothetical protein
MTYFKNRAFSKLFFAAFYSVQVFAADSTSIPEDVIIDFEDRNCHFVGSSEASVPLPFELWEDFFTGAIVEDFERISALDGPFDPAGNFEGPLAIGGFDLLSFLNAASLDVTLLRSPDFSVRPNQILGALGIPQNTLVLGQGRIVFSQNWRRDDINRPQWSALISAPQDVSSQFLQEHSNSLIQLTAGESGGAQTRVTLRRSSIQMDAPSSPHHLYISSLNEVVGIELVAPDGSSIIRSGATETSSDIEITPQLHVVTASSHNGSSSVSSTVNASSSAGSYSITLSGVPAGRPLTITIQAPTDISSDGPNSKRQRIR